MNYKELSLDEIKDLWKEQMEHMMRGTHDNKIINDLAVEVRERGEENLVEDFQRNVFYMYQNYPFFCKTCGKKIETKGEYYCDTCGNEQFINKKIDDSLR